MNQFPTRVAISREAEAAARDRADLAALSELRTILSIALARAGG
jgi:hypothetical protein